MSLLPLPPEQSANYDSDSLIYKSDTEFFYADGIPSSIVQDIQNHEMQFFGGYYKFEDGWDSPKLYYLCRGLRSGKFKLKIQGYYPYGYDYSDDGEFKTYLGRKCEKISFKGMHPANVKFYREAKKKRGYPLPLEMDILFHRRFAIDSYDFFKPKEKINPMYAIVDIETDFPVSDEIISFAINNPDGDIYYESKFDTPDKNELVVSLYEKLQEFDVILAWMGEDRFDLRIMDKAFKKIGMPPLTESVVVLDLIEISHKMHGREIRGNWKLDNVGKRLCGIAKSLDEDDMKLNVRELNEDKLFHYNVIDTVIPEIIDYHFGGLEGHIILGWALQSMMEDMMITAVVNDIALLRAYHKAGQVLYSREYSEIDKKAKYRAAEPVAREGVYEGIITLDLVHSYPTAVISLNISPETKDENGIHIAPNGVRFNDGKSVFIDTLKDLMKERKVVKTKLKQLEKDDKDYKKLKSIDFALKTQIAAFSHGIFGWVNSRMKDMEVADAITSVVREITNKIKLTCDLSGLKWIYCHTDSVYINDKKENVDKTTKYLNNTIKKYCKDYIVFPELEFKGYYKIGYIHSPARNVLVPEEVDIDDDENWESTGCNFMRSEVSEPLAQIEIELIKLKLKHKDNKLIDKLKEMIKELPNKKPSELALVKPLNKKVSEYGKKLLDGTIGNVPFHITAMKRSHDEYGLELVVKKKYGILPVVKEEYEGIRVKKRKIVHIAFDLDDGLRSEYKIDYLNYLKSNLFGKVNGLFSLSIRDLEKAVLTEDVKEKLGI